MKKNRFLLSAFFLMAALTVSACNLREEISNYSYDSNSSLPVSNSEIEEQLHKIHALYLEQGGDLTYEEWLRTIKGEKGDQGPEGQRGPAGQDGHTPVISIGDDGFWYIDGVNTKVRAQGETGAQGPQGEIGPKGDPGKDGEDGKSAYELYKETHPEYTKTEEEWLDDLINGRLSEKQIHTITFNSSGGSAVETQYIEHGEKIIKPDDPIYDGHVFNGWYYKDSLWSFVGYVVTDDMTLTASWSLHTRNVIYLDDNDNTLASIDVPDNEVPSFPYGTPTKESNGETEYQFIEWKEIISNENTVVLKAQFAESTKGLTFNGNTLLKYTGEANKVIIPAYWNGKRITKIDERAFFDSSIKEVVIPYGIISIGEIAFNSCNNLREIIIPDSVTSIGDNAFSHCQSLERIKLSNNLTVINTRLLSSCPLLETVEIPEGVLSIQSSAFEGDVSLKNITIPDSVVEIKRNILNGCSSLQTLFIPKGLRTIYPGALSGMVSLKSLEVDENNPYFTVYDNSLYNKEKDTLILFPLGRDETSYTIPSFVKTIYGYAFAGNAKLESITFSNGLQEIGEYAFAYNAKLESITFSNGLKEIGDYAFASCTSFNEIILPDTVSSLGRNAFSGCTNLVCVSLSDILEEIPYCLFNDCTSLESVHLPKSLVSIGDDAFYRCHALTGINLPDGLTSIGKHAFFECYGIDSLALPNTLNFIEARAFQKCKNLSSNITIPEDVKVISEGVFDSCFSLTSVSLSSKTTSIGGDAFAYTAISSIDLPDTVTEIQGGAFNNVKTLKNISIPNNLQTIGNSAFKNCEALESLTIPSSVTSIGSYAFYRCFSLATPLAIPEGITRIEESTFEVCDKIPSINIPDSVTSIGKRAFNSCRSLRIDKLPSNLVTIGEEAFCGCLINSLTLPSSLVEIGNNAFAGCTKIAEIINESPLVITQGSNENGSIGYYAMNVVNNPNDSKITIDDNGFVMFNDGADIWLVDYIGEQTDLIIPNGVTKIRSTAFQKNKIITSVTIPDSVKEMEEKVFSWCESIRSIIIGNGVEAIPQDAFEYCYSLESLTYGSGIKSIVSCYYGITNLKYIYYYGTKAEWQEIEIAEYGGHEVGSVIYYYSESEPQVAGNYWHYVEGVPTIW